MEYGSITVTADTGEQNNETSYTEQQSNYTQHFGHVVDRTLSRAGNIGVTTTQQMLESERNLAHFNLIKIVANDIIKQICNNFIGGIFMQITFYNNKSDKRHLSKHISALSTIEADLLEPCDITAASLMVARESIPGYAQCNYFYIREFRRYYFANLTALPGDMLQVNGKVDVLMSFKIPIMSINTTIKRQEYNYNMYFRDELFPLRSTKNLQWAKIGTYDAGTGIYLTVDGGKV